MGELANAFLEAFHVDGVFHEWMRHIRAKVDGSVFSIFILECLKDPENHKRRLQYIAFTVFINSRTWPEAAAAISAEIPAGDRDLLKEPHAETFYNEVRAFVTLQIQDYQRQFIAQAKDLSPVDVTGVMTKEDIVKTVDQAIEQAIKKAIETIRREIGEDWKGDAE